MGVMLSQLERLLAGQASLGVAQRLGVMQSDVQRFIDGEVSLGMARAIGSMMSPAQEMRNHMDRDAASASLSACVLTAAQPGEADAASLHRHSPRGALAGAAGGGGAGVAVALHSSSARKEVSTQ